MERKKYSKEYKEEAIRLVVEMGVSAAQAARDLGINDNMLRRWIKEYGTSRGQAFPGNGRLKADQLENKRLKKEVARLKAENEILKKAAAYFAKESM